MGQGASGKRAVSREQSWTHALAIRACLKSFAKVRALHEGSEIDQDAYFICLAEFLFWGVIVDEGNKRILRGFTSPSGHGYEDLKARSIDGQHVIAAKWARNKITHCVSRPVADHAGLLGESFTLDESTLGQEFRWIDREAMIAQGIDVDEVYAREPRYDEHFAGRSVYETLLPCVRWLSEVWYYQPDPNWVERKFESKGETE